ncbi:hypothetical protein AANUM_1113 [Aggregatibacter actinomycetemcomitans NUM4039]|nr:hypothetical protein AANUM_1113 [Aggregatibacter actinomycetemcomitans NUM4039]
MVFIDINAAAGGLSGDENVGSGGGRYTEIALKIIRGDARVVTDFDIGFDPRFSRGIKCGKFKSCSIFSATLSNSYIVFFG